MSNWLYLCTDHHCLTKVGVTSEIDPQTRVNTFSKDYDNKFDIVVAIPVNSINAKNLESFFHNLLNSQLLNIKLLVEEFNIVELDFQKIVNSKADGYTEVFLSNPNYLANLLVYANFFDLIDVNEENLNKICEIKTFPLKEFFKNQNVNKKLSKIKEFGINLPEATFLKNNEINGHVNSLRRNNGNFFETCNDSSIYTFDIKGNDILINNGIKKLNLNLFVNSNNNQEYRIKLLSIFKEIKLNSNNQEKETLQHFFNIAQSFSSLTKSISTQKRNKPANFNNVYSLIDAKQSEIPLIIKYLDLLENADFLSLEFKKVLNVFKKEFINGGFIEKYPRYEKNINKMFSDLIKIENPYSNYTSNNNLTSADIIPLIEKLTCFIAKIINKEEDAKQVLEKEIGILKNFKENMKIPNLDNKFFSDSLNDVLLLNIIPQNSLIGSNYVTHKLNREMFSQEYANSNYKESYLKSSKRNFENKAFLIEKKIALEIFELSKITTYNFDEEAKEILSIENLHHNHHVNNTIDRNFLWSCKIEDKTLKEIYDSSLKLNKEKIKPIYVECLEKYDYHDDLSKIENIKEKYGFRYTQFDLNYVYDQKHNEHNSFNLVKRHYLLEKKESLENDRIIATFSNLKNIKAVTWSEYTLLSEFFKDKTTEEKNELLTQSITFEDRDMTIKGFIAMMQARSHAKKEAGKYSLNHAYSLISSFDASIVPIDKFMQTVNRWNEVLFSEQGELLYDKKEYYTQRDTTKANSLLVIINILKNMEYVSEYKEYKLPEEFTKNISNNKYVSNVIEQHFSELKKYLINHHKMNNKNNP